MARFLLLAVVVGVSVWMMEALPAKPLRPSFNGMRSLFSSIQDDMMPAVPAMMMMPSIVYYHVVSPYDIPFHRMGKFPTNWSKLIAESSEEEDEEAEESKIIEETSEDSKRKGEIVAEDLSKKTSIAEEKESPKEEEEKEEEENEEVTESATEETTSVEGNESPQEEDEVTTLIPNTETTNPQTTEQDEEEEEISVVAETTTTTTESQQTNKSILLEDKLSIKPDNFVKTSARSSSTTYVCKFGKCQHTMEAKKKLEQEIEAELWAKF